jgi:isoleucyl-tRNA synthetase
MRHSRALGDDLRFVLITSSATLTLLPEGAAAQSIARRSSSQPKCDRCWHWRSDVGQ